MRIGVLTLFLILLTPAVAWSRGRASPTPRPHSSLAGEITDSTGAFVPGAQVELIDAAGRVAASVRSDGEGRFQMAAPRAGRYTLMVSAPGFEPVRKVLTFPAASGSSSPVKTARPAPSIRIVLSVAAVATSVHVSAATGEELTESAANGNSAVMTSQDLKSLPILDNDYVTAMSVFLDSSAVATGGTGLLVNGVEVNRPTVSASAIEEVRINQDPYSAQYYWPGRGQMEIITQPAGDHYHGQFNFLFRDSAMDAQNALAPSKPFEQRQDYEGNLTGPIFFAPKNSFLATFNRVVYDQDAVVNATIAPTAANPGGAYSANVPAPTRDTEFSLQIARPFGDRNSGYVQSSYQDTTGQHQGVGGLSLAAAGYGTEHREDDTVLHLDSIFSSTLLNQATVLTEIDSDRNSDAAEAPAIIVSGDFIGGSAQNDSYATELNLAIDDVLSWTRGRHLIKAGINLPHIDRRGFDDHTNELGTYTFGPTLAADGVTVLATALENYAANLPSGFSESTGTTHFVDHQQELGAFVQDQFQINTRFSITPGLRYDWQNLLATRRLGFAPRFSFAWVLNEKSKTVVRGGGGIYYDRPGAGPLLDLERYEHARRRMVVVSLDPARLPATGCVPITNCVTLADLPPSLAQMEPGAKLPYQIQYGLSIERSVGQDAILTLGVSAQRGIHNFRSVDVNAPTPASGYTERPDPAYARIRQMQPEGFWENYALDISYRGRLNRYFTGFGRYVWSHCEGNTDGIRWFPQNQYDPNDEWGNSSWDRRQQLNLYAIFQPQSLFNLAVGIFAETGTPWTILTGTDPYGDDLFNARPAGVARDSMTNPGYVDLDLRWEHDFALTAKKSEQSTQLGVSAGAFNVLNHLNGIDIDPVATSSSFGRITAADPPRRIELGMRFEF
ncbi:MAG: TonB-dependent receptor domain-containing protein [Terracidiphilus sp.]